MPVAADTGHYLRVSVLYSDGHGSGKTAQMVAPNVVLARTLSRLEVVTTSSRQMYPAFDPAILHYAVGCIAADTLSLTRSTTDTDTCLAVDGVQYANQHTVVESTDKGDGSGIVITLSGPTGANTTYTVNCLDHSFPIVEAGGESDTFITSSVTRQEAEADFTHLAVLDDNGVPRLRRQINASNAMHVGYYCIAGARSFTYPKRGSRIFSSRNAHTQMPLQR